MTDLKHSGWFRDCYLQELRMEFAFMPRWVYVSKAEWHAKMQAHYEERVQALSRPAYNEPAGFTHDHWGKTGRASIAGREKPYAWSRPYWQAFGRMLKHALLAGVYEAMPEGGGVHHRYDSRRNQLALVTGLTS